MIFFCIGFPSRFTEWCDAVTSCLAHCALGSAEVIILNTLDELALATIRTGASHYVACSRQPTGGVGRALAEANRPFVAVLDDPFAAVQDLVTRFRLDLVEATRVVASSCASLFGYVAMPKALVLNAVRDGHDPVAAATAIARHLDLSVNEADIANIVESLKDAGVVPLPNEDRAWWDSLDESERALVSGALGAYVDYFVGKDFGTITWERELFFVADEPAGRADRPIDITGRARCLLYGPYIMLPPGSWSASVGLGFSKGAAELGYVVEIVAGTQLSRANLGPKNEGGFEVNLTFYIEQLMDHPIEVRLFNERAAFDGRLALSDVSLTRQLSMRKERLADFASALGP